MKILYKAPTGNSDSREVFVDDEFFTYLHYEIDSAIFVDIQHPYVNLIKLFSGVLGEEVHFHSSLDLHIEIKIL